MTQPKPYGMVAEFEDADSLLAAARAARASGYRRVEAYSPYPIRELDEVIPSWDLLSPMVFASGVAGGFIGFYMQYFIAAIVYPTNTRGMPLNSWPAFTVITFEMVVLFSVCAVFFAALLFEGLPQLYHPLFRIPTFKRVSDDGFFLCIEARDGRFEPAQAARFLQSLDPLKVWEVDSE
ncbi:MAG TPA: DUF3341 domain-containing protein [Bryobacteraceae bacterium]|nr:DUF3341 domain-containing protein [Bryobacteraceae bacterium]